MTNMFSWMMTLSVIAGNVRNICIHYPKMLTLSIILYPTLALIMILNIHNQTIKLLKRLPVPTLTQRTSHQMLMMPNLSFNQSGKENLILRREWTIGWADEHEVRYDMKKDIIYHLHVVPELTYKLNHSFFDPQRRERMMSNWGTKWMTTEIMHKSLIHQ